MNIGIDIDGVINNLDEFHIAAGTKFCYKHRLPYDMHIEKYKIREKFDWDKTIERSFYQENYLKFLTSNTYLRPYVSEAIHILHKKHNIIIITAREEKDIPSHLNLSMEELTKCWLKDNSILYDKLIFSEVDKTDIIISEKIDLMIEDNPYYLLGISGIQIDFLCFDANYNRQVLSSNIYRVYSWYDILSFMENRRNLK